MLYTTLADLDELLRSVRSASSATYLEEAIRSYQNRAYRAAIISTWVAVTYDLIGKIREMASMGDAAAIAFITQLDSAVSNANISKLQEIENKLLDSARSDFQLISDYEHTDLLRLREDRHKCAHPSFGSEFQLYSPEAELVRAHIVHAVKHLLAQAPVQGKSALARIKNDLMQPSFPTAQDAAIRFIEQRYLKRARPSLVDSLVTVLLKVVLLQSEPDLVGREAAVINTLAAVRHCFREVYESKMKELIPRYTDTLTDSELERLFRLVEADAHCWQWLPEPTRMRLESIALSSVRNLKDRADIRAMWGIPELQKQILAVFDELDAGQKVSVITAVPGPHFADDGVQLYATSGNYRTAEVRGHRVLLPLAKYLSKDQITTVLRAVSQNAQIRFADESPAILAAFFDLTEEVREDLAEEWQGLMRALQEGCEPDDHYAYPGLRRKMIAAGLWWTDDAPEEHRSGYEVPS
jgi:hypothetical protein